jgi:hypothetical protein
MLTFSADTTFVTADGAYTPLLGAHAFADGLIVQTFGAFVMPNLVGRTWYNAVEILLANDLVSDAPKLVPALGLDPGIVMSQSFPPGAVVQPNTLIQLTVSNSPYLLAVTRTEHNF